MADAGVVSPKARAKLLPRSKTAMYLFTLYRSPPFGDGSHRQAPYGSFLLDYEEIYVWIVGLSFKSIYLIRRRPRRKAWASDLACV